jgi:hypothetical protein
LLLKTQTAGRMLMAEVLERSSLLAEMDKRKTEPYAILCADQDFMALDQFAGNTAPMNSEMMVLSVTNLPHTEEEPDMLSGTKTTASVTILN